KWRGLDIPDQLEDDGNVLREDYGTVEGTELNPVDWDDHQDRSSLSFALGFGATASSSLASSSCAPLLWAISTTPILAAICLNASNMELSAFPLPQTIFTKQVPTRS
ncbi:hypothetical protein, partial [Enterobacter hormaechei]|uniref:hypothetical protein n=1 Tax=Enterobacter hormaechei TaxID=158836 RepID=UPI0023E3CD7A